MITEIERVGDKVIQQVSKPDGTVLRYQYGIPGDASSIIATDDLVEARMAIAPLVPKTVDRNGDLEVQKVTKNGKLVHYQHGSEALGWVVVKTLVEARKAIGKIT